jgi:hypothetical protein
MRGTRCGGILEHVMWASFGVISELRTRQPRDGQMKCGNQPANISMINRRQSLPRVAFPFRCEIRPIRNR